MCRSFLLSPLRSTPSLQPNAGCDAPLSIGWSGRARENSRAV